VGEDVDPAKREHPPTGGAIKIPHTLERGPEDLEVLGGEACLLGEVGNEEAVAAVEAVGYEGLASNLSCLVLATLGDGDARDGEVEWNDRVNGSGKGELERPAHLTRGVVASGHDGPKGAHIIEVGAEPPAPHLLLLAFARRILAISLTRRFGVESGEVDPEQANALTTLASAILRVYQASEFEERLRQLEQQAADEGLWRDRKGRDRGASAMGTQRLNQLARLRAPRDPATPEEWRGMQDVLAFIRAYPRDNPPALASFNALLSEWRMRPSDPPHRWDIPFLADLRAVIVEHIGEEGALALACAMDEMER
jgi:hypothetical protein